MPARRPRHGTGLTFRVVNQHVTSVWRDLLIRMSLLAATAVALPGAGFFCGALAAGIPTLPVVGVVVAACAGSQDWVLLQAGAP